MLYAATASPGRTTILFSRFKTAFAAYAERQSQGNETGTSITITARKEFEDCFAVDAT
jgi:hypothetical protein